MTDIKELKALAMKATDESLIKEGLLEPDTYDENGVVVTYQNYTMGDPKCREIFKHREAFTDAANPQAILSLIERIERYEEALRFYAAGENYEGRMPTPDFARWVLDPAREALK